MNHTANESMAGLAIGAGDVVSFVFNVLAVFLGVLLAFYLAEMAKRKERLIQRAVVPLHERASTILESFNPDMLAEYSVSESRELENFERRAQMPLAPAVFFEPANSTERTFFMRASEKWPVLQAWDEIAEDGRSAYLEIFRAQERLRRVLGSFKGRCKFPSPVMGLDDLPLRLIQHEYSSLCIREQVTVPHQLFRIEIVHGEKGGSDVCFNGIPAMSCPTSNAEQIAADLGSAMLRYKVAEHVHDARAAAKRVCKGASVVLDAAVSIIT